MFNKYSNTVLNYDIIDCIVYLYLKKCSDDINKNIDADSKFKPITNFKLQKLAYFLNVLYMLKYSDSENNIKTLFSHNAFGYNQYGAHIRQTSLDYRRAFGSNGDRITHIIPHFLCLNLDSQYLHMFNVNNFKKKYTDKYKFLVKNIPVLMAFDGWTMLESIKKEPEYHHYLKLSGDYRFDFRIKDNLTYDYYKFKNHQFWTNSTPNASSNNIKNSKYPQRLIIHNNQNQFNILMSKLNSYGFNAYKFSKEIYNAPYCVSIFHRYSEYDFDNNSNIIFWLKNNTWNLSGVDYRIKSDVQHLIDDFEKQIQ